MAKQIFPLYLSVLQKKTAKGVKRRVSVTRKNSFGGSPHALAPMSFGYPAPLGSLGHCYDGSRSFNSSPAESQATIIRSRGSASTVARLPWSGTSSHRCRSKIDQDPSENDDTEEYITHPTSASKPPAVLLRMLLMKKGDAQGCSTTNIGACEQRVNHASKTPLVIM